MNKTFVDRIFDWLEKTLPGLLAAFGVGYKMGSEESEKLKGELAKKEVQLKETQIDLQVEKEFAGKSDRDVILDAIAKPTSSGADTE